MPNNVGKEWTFNTVADSYDKIRPGYPDELYQALFAYAAPDDSCSALEIGIGGGQATLPVLKTGCTLTTVEYGDQLAKVCREKFSDYSRFSVITGNFEDIDFPEDSFDLVFSASAFHWVPEIKNSRESLANTRKNRLRQGRRLRTDMGLWMYSICCFTEYEFFRQLNTEN